MVNLENCLKILNAGLRVAGLAALLWGCTSSKNSGDTTITQVGLPLSYPGIGQSGVFDPSLASAAGSNRIWMAFSSVEQSPTWSTNTQVINSHLGYSDNSGASWTYSKILNSYLDVTVGLPAPNNAGTWINEVPVLVYDSQASQWKIFWHHYLLLNGTRLFEHGWLAYKAAATPDALDQATEHKLFTGSAYDSSNNTAGAATQTPVAGAAEVNFTALDPALSACGVLTEPGALSLASGLYLSLHCVKMSGSTVTDNLIVLLKFNGTAWTYVGTLLANADAAALGYDSGFSATDLFQSNGQQYLAVTPVSSKPFAGFYNGCVIYQFTDITTGTLLKSNGQPSPVKTLQGTATRFNGGCSFNSGATSTGFIYGELDLSGATPVFSTVKSGITL